MALIFNELATNCLKHAFRAREAGEVSIRAAMDDEPWIEIVFADNGPGWPADVLEGQRQSIGLNLIRAVVEQEMEGSVKLCTRTESTVTS